MSWTGWGEEALFRGAIQHGLVEWWGPVAGITVSSLVFGAAHLQTHGVAGSLMVAGLGAYMGIVTHVNKYDMRSMMFMHAMWDVAVFLGDWLHDRDAIINMQLPPIRF
jgi:membrane protease YdiL (CAAX protease family)